MRSSAAAALIPAGDHHGRTGLQGSQKALTVPDPVASATLSAFNVSESDTCNNFKVDFLLLDKWS